jgi:hypothetical protein
MATARINGDDSKTLWAQIRYAANLTAVVRAKWEEIDRILDKFIDDTIGITAQTGVAAGDIALLRNLVHQSACEMSTLAAVTVLAGFPTATKQLTDAISTGG